MEFQWVGKAATESSFHTPVLLNFVANSATRRDVDPILIEYTYNAKRE